MAAHPRSRGENPFPSAKCAGSLGSSPLTRGKPRKRWDQICKARLIPAHAGKTCARRRAGSPMTAHPRSRGENISRPPLASWKAGSSPLTRGKRQHFDEDTPGGGLIPAHAGKTVESHGDGPVGRAHPRSRGENHRSSRPPRKPSGSSPLTRGKRPDADGGGSAERLIPAHAGKTVAAACQSSCRTAHPRSRGENCRSHFSTFSWSGSSPLTRGKRQWRPTRQAQ